MKDLINKVIQGDCLKVMKQIPDNSIDLILTDPAYRVISGGNNHPSINMKGSVIGKNDGKIFDNNDIKISEWLPEVKRVMKDNTHGYCFTNQLNLLPFLMEFEKLNLSVYRILIWDKGIATWTQFYMKQYEPIIFFRKGNAKKINNQGTKDVLSVPNTKNKLHPTEKPINLFEILLDNSSNKNDLILDPFLGSGTTAVACQNLGRRFIGIELSEKYCQIARDRLKQQTLI